MTTLLVGALAAGVAARSMPDAQRPGEPRQVVIVVVGAGGTAEHTSQFGEWAGLWERACSNGNVKFVGIGLDNVRTQADHTNLQKVLADESKEAAGALWLVLIGHGTFDGRTAKFNLRGPDVSADELAEWLKPMARPIVVINTASSSAPFLKELSAPGRVIVTATKSGFEQNYTRFGQYLAGAIIEREADLDKDGQTSLLEAFLTASHRVDEFYSAAGRLATEHALLDDNGDALGTPADWFRGIRPVRKAADDASGSLPGRVSLDGYRAHQLHILHSDAEAKMPRDLRAKRDQLELEVMKLRDTKASFSENEYFSKLEELLHEIARIYEQVDIAEETR